MIVGAPLLFIGLVVGLLLRRWTVVVVVTVACLLVSAIGVPLGWFGDEDMPSLGGAIILAMFFWGPFVVGLGIGVTLRRRRRMPGG
jgi:hypothetical protein